MELLTWLDPQTIFLRGNLYFMGDLGWEIQEQNPQEKAIEEDRFWPTREKLRLKNWRWFAQRYADQIMTNLRYLRLKKLTLVRAEKRWSNHDKSALSAL